jgi:1-acyl-sn-glycerol-3-phosphate acyltransferase
MSLRDFFYYFCRDLTLFIPNLTARTHYDGFEHVPKSGPGLVLSNHISHFDPSFMMAKFPRIVHFMADKPLLAIPIFGRMLAWGYVFAIDRTKNDRAALRTVLARLEGGNLVGIFPEKGIRHGATSVLGGAELPIGTASLWKLTDVPVIPMVILGTDQIYAWRNLFTRPRIFVRVGAPLAPDREATKEELRDRIVAAWHELYDSIQRDYNLRPDELPQSAQERWGRAPVPPKNEEAKKGKEV